MQSVHIRRASSTASHEPHGEEVLELRDVDDFASIPEPGNQSARGPNSAFASRSSSLCSTTSEWLPPPGGLLRIRQWFQRSQNPEATNSWLELTPDLPTSGYHSSVHGSDLDDEPVSDGSVFSSESNEDELSSISGVLAEILLHDEEFDSFDSSSDDPEEDSVSSVGVSITKAEVVDRLMAYFFQVLAIHTAQGQGGTTSRDNRKSTMQEASTTPSNPDEKGHGLKRQSSGRPTGDLESNDDDDLARKRPRAKDKSSDSDGPCRLACPFFKNNPRKYCQKRSCTGPGFKTCHRVKEHLYRLHTRPIHCLRCYETFPTDELLAAHMREEVPCAMQAVKEFDGLTKQQEARLKSRGKARAAKSTESEEDRWRQVYRILFPFEDPSSIPSPYYEYSDLRDEATPTTAREMPREIRSELESRLDTILVHAEVDLRSQIPALFRDLQLRLVRRYIEDNGQNPAPSIDAPTALPDATGLTGEPQLHSPRMVGTMEDKPEDLLALLPMWLPEDNHDFGWFDSFSSMQPTLDGLNPVVISTSPMRSAFGTEQVSGTAGILE